MLDVLGTRRGFTLIMLWWSVACALHGLAMNFGFLLAARCLLGMGEGGAFPAAPEWLRSGSRSTGVLPRWASSTQELQWGRYWPYP
jgi:ACS family hexuronate transporter-like MFS transporter